MNRRRFLGGLGASIMLAAATSMGMRTFAPKLIEGRVPANTLDGLTFDKWESIELLEFSLVANPVNPACVVKFP